MSTTDNNNSSTAPDASGTSAAEGNENVGSTDSLSLAELNQFLGRDFKDTTSALKALKDTQDFVGKRKEDIAAEVRASLAGQTGASQGGVSEERVKALELENFYAKNPQFKGYEAVIAKMGSNPAEVVESAEFKFVFEKGQKADEVAQTRSVVSSSSRLGASKSVTDEAIRVANETNSVDMTADVLAKGINEALSS